MSGRSSNSVWSVPSSFATRRAWGSSLYEFSSKPIEKVFTGRSMMRLMSATTALESMPPLRKAPSGTSLINR